jgi:archaellum component FlaC
MSLTIETELKDIFNKLDQRLERMEQGINDLKLGQSEIKGEIRTLDERLTGEIRTLDEKLSGQIKAVDEKLSGQIKAVDERLSGQITNLETKVTATNEKVDTLQKAVTKLDTDVSAVKQDISDLKGVKSLIIPAVVAILVSLFSLLVRGINIS